VRTDLNNAGVGDTSNVILNKFKERSDSRATQQVWIDDVLETIEQAKTELNRASSSKETKAILRAVIKDKTAELAVHRQLIKEYLVEDYKDILTLEASLKGAAQASKKPEVKKRYQTVSLLRSVLGAQLRIPGGKLEKGKEGMAIQLLNSNLGITSAFNCRSGLDRTGLWFAQKMAMENIEKAVGPDGLDGPDRMFRLVNDWDTTTRVMNGLAARLSKREGEQKNLANVGTDKLAKPFSVGNAYSDWIGLDPPKPGKPLDDWKKDFPGLLPKDITEKQFMELQKTMYDAALLRNHIFKNLITVGVPITTRSTGVEGLKWNEGMQENLVPLNFLPAYVIKNTEVKKIDGTGEEKISQAVSLVRCNQDGSVAGMSWWGRRLLTIFQAWRGS